MQQPIVSVVVVVCDRAQLVDAMLSSLARQTEPRFEALVLLNSATDEMRSTVERHMAEDPRISTIECDSEDNASTARNLGVAHANGSIVYFLDDDTEVPENGLETLTALASARPEVDIFGGPNLTPKDDPVFAHITGAILANAIGTGPARSRYAKVRARAALERHLILCNLAVRRRVFESGIEFPVLFGGEENTLMGHASASGFKLWYSPELWVYHRRRRTLSGYLEQMVRYGRGRAIAMRWAPRTFHVAYLLPVALLAYLIALIPLMFVSFYVALPALLYLALITAASFEVVVRERKPLWLPYVLALFIITHVAYAFGLLTTLARLAAGRDGQG